MPASDTSVVLVTYCARTVFGTESRKTNAPTAMRVLARSDRSAIRTTADTAYSISTSPSHSMVWSTPMPSSRALRQRLSSTGRASRASARSMKSRMPAPNSSEKTAMNFWSTKISPKMPTAQSQPRPGAPGAEVQIGRQSVAEGHRIHQQDAQYGHAADQIQAGDPIRFGDRPGSRRCTFEAHRDRLPRWDVRRALAEAAPRAYGLERRRILGRRRLHTRGGGPLQAGWPRWSTRITVRG